MSNPKVERIIARLQRRITEGAEGEQYEAGQETRVVAARYTKSENWPAAIDILFNVSQSLLKAGAGGSGGDLACLLVDVYNKSETTPDATSKGRLLTLLRLFDAGEPTRKKFVKSVFEWSRKHGSYPAGDPEMHHVVGSIFASEHETDEAERHLILGTKESPEILTRMEYEWYKEDDEGPHMAPVYCARAVLPYLLIANVRAANISYRTFISALSSDNKGLSVQDVSSQGADIRIFPSLPLLNFLGLLLLAVQKGNPELFRQLKSKYGSHIQELGGAWDGALEMIAEMYFGIQRPRQSNPLFDMMGSLFGGGGGGGAAAGGRPPVRRVEPAPAAEGLD
ncbi:Golgi to ER traffic protein 4 [Rhypophila decipiens]|uniref:Golgi to ER traffic protein 4 n=1 Tax=Rhypophila decipiens TaxID=261697 RepID=A0AAN7B455_9PEZI|nr:Golgi to ER traffic protein 4 [Rhypophila decipiens]